MGKEDVSGFSDIMQKRAAALVPKKTVGSDEKSGTSWLEPRLGRWFIRTAKVENAKGLKAKTWLSVGGFFGNLLSPCGLLLGIGGGAAMSLVTEHKRHGYYPIITYAVLLGISIKEAIKAVNKNTDSTAIELVGEVCGRANTYAAIASSVPLLGAAGIGTVRLWRGRRRAEANVHVALVPAETFPAEPEEQEREKPEVWVEPPPQLEERHTLHHHW